MRGRGVLRSAALLVALAGLGLFATSASATQFQRPFLETLGSVEQPSFEHAESIAVDPTSGDVLVGVQNGDFGTATATFSRFHADGTPAPFGALGTNTIDGKGSGSCAFPPTPSPDCDKTQQNGLTNGAANHPPDQIAIDPTNGNIYITQVSANVVDIFSADGKYLGQLTKAGTNFGQPCGVVVDSAGAVYIAQNNKISKFVPSANPPVNTDNTANFRLQDSNDLCRMALGDGPSAGSIFIANVGHPLKPQGRILKVNTATGGFSVFAEGYEGLVAVDPSSGNPSAYNSYGTLESGFAELTEFDGSLEATNSPLSRLLVKKPELTNVKDYAIDSAGRVYVTYGLGNAHPASILVYGQPVLAATVSINPASDVTASEATLSGSVNPEGVEVGECVFEWGEFIVINGFHIYEHTTPCEGSTIPTDSSDHEVHARIPGLKPNEVKYGFRLAAKNANGVTEYSSTETFNTGSAAETKPATVTGISTATLNGAVRPEGHQYTECLFEWGLTTSAEYEHTAPCDPKASEIPADSGVHAVRAPLTGLQEEATYRFRLKATNDEGAETGSELTFETLGHPKIVAIRASDATQTTAKLEAEIDPNSFATSYRFEWGPTSSYGHLAPASFESIGSGTSPVRVIAELSGLSAESTYHYRVIASGEAGTTVSSDQVLETLNACGLPEGRCFELVSRRDPGPVAIPGEAAAAIDLRYQAATGGPGTLAYPVESGYSEATKGYSVLYRGTRGPSGWNSAQLSTPILAQNETGGNGSRSGSTLWLADDLSCGFGDSNQPLTDDPGPRLTYELGGKNLYRLNPSGSYTAVSELAPENPESSGGGDLEVLGASQDCGKVLFSTAYRYPSISGAEEKQPLYEWDEGTLRNAGLVPGPSGEAVVEAKGGAFNAVSEDGSRVFFSAERKTSPSVEEIGKTGVFVREDDTTRDLSLSETSAPDNGAVYLWATPDGSRVFFLANYGLTSDSSAGATTNNCAADPSSAENKGLCDLYEYDLEREELTDLSVDHEAEGAQVGVFIPGRKVGGFVAASEDGSHVYFIARGQFFPGKGATTAQNKSADTYSLYGVAGGKVSFVGTVGGGNDELNILTAVGDRNWNSIASPNGRYLLFQTRANLTAYDSGGAPEAYLYDAEDGPEGRVVCVSCRPDGQPSLVTPEHSLAYQVLSAGEAINNPRHPPQFLTIRGGEPQVFFTSLDPLAPGAVPGQNNVYEWAHGQVFRLTSAREGQQSLPASGYFAGFLGASDDGSDAYLVSPETLNWEDGNERLSIYDARIGGGFPEPPAPPAPCDPDAEGSCQGSSQASAPPAPGAGSATFSGPGNAKAKQVKKHKKKHRKHRKHRKKRGRKGHGKHKKAHANRRAGK